MVYFVQFIPITNTIGHGIMNKLAFIALLIANSFKNWFKNCKLNNYCNFHFAQESFPLMHLPRFEHSH